MTSIAEELNSYCQIRLDHPGNFVEGPAPIQFNQRLKSPSHPFLLSSRAGILGHPGRSPCPLGRIPFLRPGTGISVNFLPPVK